MYVASVLPLIVALARRASSLTIQEQGDLLAVTDPNETTIIAGSNATTYSGPAIFPPYLPGDPNFQAIPTALFDSFVLMEQYAAAAYCEYNDELPQGGRRLACDHEICPLVEQKDQITTYEFFHSGWQAGTGYVALDNTNHLTILAYKGSTDVVDWYRNLQAIPTRCGDVCFLCMCHDGFWETWLQTRDGVVAAIQSAIAAQPQYRLVVVGHSLGGALATFAAHHLRSLGHELDLYTYGQPRVGNELTASVISRQGKGNNYRISHKNDPVPGVPPWLAGYVHIWPQYYISSANYITPTPKDVAKWVVEESPATNGSVAPIGYDTNNTNVINIEAHLWYFRQTSGCTLQAGVPLQNSSTAISTSRRRRANGAGRVFDLYVK